MGFLSLKYNYVGKKIYEYQTNADLDQKQCFFPCEFADLRFPDWDTKEICGVAICGLIIADLIWPDSTFKLIYFHRYAQYE